jgi:hypothetical protein
VHSDVYLNIHSGTSPSNEEDIFNVLLCYCAQGPNQAQKQNNENENSAGLPDGLFSNQNPNLGLKNVYILMPICNILGYFITIWLSLFSFGTMFPRFGIMYQEKSGNPGTVEVLYYVPMYATAVA